ncbi:MAG: universal stress protein [Deltaproteobacteria bacterium]|nr:universal stress protein [Deltaproteobacteria bacterium]
MKIMVCHDGSKRSQDALEKTVELFKSQKPEIILISVVEEPLDATSMDEESFEKWRSKRDGELRKAAEWVVTHGLDVDAILAVGDPRKMILEAAGTKNPDMLVVARRGSGILDKMILGSVSAFLVRHAECPVLVMHG